MPEIPGNCTVEFVCCRSDMRSRFAIYLQIAVSVDPSTHSLSPRIPPLADILLGFSPNIWLTELFLAKTGKYFLHGTRITVELWACFCSHCAHLTVSMFQHGRRWHSNFGESTRVSLSRSALLGSATCFEGRLAAFEVGGTFARLPTSTRGLWISLANVAHRMSMQMAAKTSPYCRG